MASPTLDLKTRVITMCKPSPDAIIGVRMRTTAAGDIRVVELNPAGALALHLSDSGEAPINRGDIVVSINGVACDGGPAQAARLMNEAPRMLRIELASRGAATAAPPSKAARGVVHAFRCQDGTCTVPDCAAMKRRLDRMRWLHSHRGCCASTSAPCPVCQLLKALKTAEPEPQAPPSSAAEGAGAPAAYEGVDGENAGSTCAPTPPRSVATEGATSFGRALCGKRERGACSAATAPRHAARPRLSLMR